jgi:regulator of sigma E protease
MGMCLIAGLPWLLTPAGLLVILKVALALGAVIFVHELGHFLVAKACGVKCEKFFIGFDIGGYKLSHRWGETEYGIGILPLGGYVKMLGQDDDPAHIAEQMRKSEINAGSPDAVEIVGPNGEKYHVDRRSYLAQSVPERMAIISAGVIMNVIFAFIFAAIAYGMGVSYLPCIVSETVPGSPAWRAGIEPGDEVVQIGNRVNPTFMQLKSGVTLGDLKNGLPCVIHRAADGKDVALTLTPEGGHGLATVGIVMPRSMTLSEGLPTFPGSPAAEAKLVDPSPASLDGDAAKLHGGDEIVRVGDVAVGDYRAFATEVARHPDQPLRITLKRSEKTAAGAGESSEQTSANTVSKELTFELPTRARRTFGLEMTLGPITAIQVGSPAAAAGLKVGDTIVAVDGHSLNAADREQSAWTPDTLPERIRQAAVAGRTVELTILRHPAEQPGNSAHANTNAASSDDASTEKLQISVVPRIPTEFYASLPPIAGVPKVVPALGLSYQIGNKIVAVAPGGPAAAVGIEAGDTITSAKFVLPKDVADVAGNEAVKLSDQDRNWPMLIEALQMLPTGTAIDFTIASDNEEHREKLVPVAEEDCYIADRGFNFLPIERVRKATTLGQQVSYGLDETTDALTMVYRFLQKLGTGQVPASMIGGPLTIAGAAGQAASAGLSTLLIFLTMLSANLAVINFLPIPLLDGGHMVFLAYEGLRRRPASEKFVVAMHTAGFMFLVSLMLFAIVMDVHRLF